MHPHQLGRCSEDLACEHLLANGWTILERNYRAGHKEVDIIARLGNTVAFVEVKARAGRGWGHPLDAITWSKRREIAHVARSWLLRHGRAALEYRFDAIAVEWRGEQATVEHLAGAWTLTR